MPRWGKRGILGRSCEVDGHATGARCEPSTSCRSSSCDAGLHAANLLHNEKGVPGKNGKAAAGLLAA